MAAAKKTEPVEAKPIGNDIKIETANNIYVLKKPTGKLGALHFRLLTKAMPQSATKDGDQTLVSPADQERLSEVFEQWIDQVLPNILISPTYDEVPGEDQWFIFLAMFQTMNISSDLFRIIR